MLISNQFQILCIYDRLDEIDLEAVAKYVSGLQQPDGSFFGDKWGEVDTRFSFCAVAILTLIVSVPHQCIALVMRRVIERLRLNAA